MAAEPFLSAGAPPAPQRCIHEYPNLSGYVRDVYQTPGVAASVDMQHIKVGASRRRWVARRRRRMCTCYLPPTRQPGILPILPSPSTRPISLPPSLPTAQTHYFTSHPRLNHYAIVPAGGEAWWAQPHDRAERFGGKA